MNRAPLSFVNAHREYRNESIPCTFDDAGTNGADGGVARPGRRDVPSSLSRVLLLLIPGCKLITTSKLKLAAMTKASVTTHFLTPYIKTFTLPVATRIVFPSPT